MIRLVIVLAGILSACAVAAPDVACAQSSLQTSLPTSRSLARFGLERAWWSQATLDTRRDRVLTVTLDDMNFYVHSTGGIVTAFDNEDGRKRWSEQLGYRDTPSYPAVSNDELVLVIAGMTMYALEPLTGNLKWELKLPNQPSTSPTIDARQVYYGTLDGSIYAFDLKKIAELHSKGQLPQFTNVAQAWRYKTAKEVLIPPVSDDYLLHVASRDKSVYALTAIDRKLQWQFETDSAVSANLGSSANRLFIASEDYNVFCIDKTSGSVKWQFVAGLPVRKSARILGDDVFVFPDRGGVYCLNQATGTRRWWRPNVADFVGGSQDAVFVTDESDNLVALDRRDGAVIGALPLQGFPVRFANELTDRLFIVSETGLVVCLREIGKEFPTYHRYPEREPILPELAPDDESVDPDAAGDTTDGTAADTDNTSGFSF